MSDPFVEAIKWISIIASIFLIIGATLLACSGFSHEYSLSDGHPFLQRLFKKLPKVILGVVGRRIYVGLALIIIALIVFLPFLAHVPIFTVAGLFIFAVPFTYCFLDWITETPFPTPPGSGKLLFAGAFTDRENRWNVVVDVALIGLGLFSASYVQRPERVDGIYSLYIFLAFYALLVVVMILACQCHVAGEKAMYKARYDEFKNQFVKHGGTLSTWEPSSVYADPAISLWESGLKVFAPQLIAIVLYVISFYTSDPRSDSWGIAYGVLGAFFIPITLFSVGLPEIFQDLGILWQNFDNLNSSLRSTDDKDRRDHHGNINRFATKNHVGFYGLVLSRGESGIEQSMKIVDVVVVDEGGDPVLDSDGNIILDENGNKTFYSNVCQFNSHFGGVRLIGRFDPEGRFGSAIVKLGLSAEDVHGAITLAIGGMPAIGLSDEDFLELNLNEQRPLTLRLMLRGDALAYGQGWEGFLRLLMTVIANIIFPFFLIFTLPVFLAKSESQTEFVLNAMAMLFVVMLDDIPEGKRNVYTCSLLEDLAKSACRDMLENTEDAPPPLPPRDPATEEPTATDLESG